MVWCTLSVQGFCNRTILRYNFLIPLEIISYYSFYFFAQTQ